MNSRAVFHLIAHLLIVIGIGMAVCWGIALYFDDPWQTQKALALSAAVTLLIGLILKVSTPRVEDLSLRDGIGVVTFGWLTVALFGALPFLLSGEIRDPTGAFFESVSGFTTTGASVMNNLEAVARGVLFWRALTHFLGGMGVLVLCVAILPFLGIGGMSLYRAEVSGPTKERLTPRIASTAKLLWGVYVLLCAANAVLLRFGGMTWFDAVCHAFATIATGGFSTRTASIGAYNSPYIEAVTVFFMFVGATNFALHYGALRGKVLGYFKDPEFRLYLGLWLLSCLAVSWNIWHRVYDSAWSALRNGFFSTTSLLCTTGFATVDFDLWPAMSKAWLLVLMILGGCVGSTGGGIKQMRTYIALKSPGRWARVFMQPQAVIQVKMGATPVPDPIVLQVMGYIVLYLLMLALAALAMTILTGDIMTSFASVIATMGGVGPGFGQVGPMQNYAGIPDVGKGILILCMLLGRLEFYTLLVVFLPRFWKK
ncbi:MAG: TrkH family potassium uptake protein [Verrucomicrobia bacterium]|nr:TrkH family potassium uptake protein [Verrucomicrobiota bacterium]MBU1909434.1 TrkH family potassium uptake protein [Verrucomicrobiota bacterium]